MKFRPWTLFARNVLLASTAVCAISSTYAQSGSWSGATSMSLWSGSANWTGGVVANGAGNTASFTAIDLPAGFFDVVLDSPRTLGNLTFGDTNTATAGTWSIYNNGIAANILTLAGAPVVTVNAMGTGSYAELMTEVAGTHGLTKAGPGTLVLSGTNTYSGSTTASAGTLSINSATAIGTSSLTMAGGNLDSLTGATLTTANPQTWSNDFSFIGTANLNLGTGAVSMPAARTVTIQAGVLTVGGVITSGVNPFTKEGAGELVFGGNNTNTLQSDFVLKGGIFRLGGGQANVQNAIGSVLNPVSFAGGILALNGANGTFNATAWGTFSNPISVAAGQTGGLHCHPRGVLASTVTGAGTLNLQIYGTRLDQNGNWSGFTGTVNVTSNLAPTFADFRINGTSQFANAKLHLGPSVYMVQIFNPPNNAVGTTQSIGELSGNAGSVLVGSGVAGRFVNWSVGALNTSSEFAGDIANAAGAARLYKVGTGTLTLSGANSYTGDTQVNAGKLQIGNGGATGVLGATNAIVAAGAELAFNRDATTVSTYPGILSGAGVVRKVGSGQVNFHGVNTYTAGTLIQGGTIGINSTSSLGDPAGAVSFSIADGGVLSTVPAVVSARTFTIASGITASFGGVTAADSLEISSVISGAGNLGVKGDGLIRLTGANTYGGNTTVTTGTLAVANVSGSATSAGAVTMAGGKLAGIGSIAGTVTTVSGVELKPGPVTPTSSNVGTLTTGGLSLAGGAVMRFEIADAANYDKIVVTGANALTSSASLANPVLVDPRIANSAAKWTSPGNFNILTFTGSFAGNADDLFEVPAASRQPGLTYSFAVVGNAIQLQIGGSPPSTWNVDANGNWGDAGNWLNGTPNGVGAFADFGSIITAPRTVSLVANRTVGLMQFNNANPYTLTGPFTITFDQSIGNSQISVLNGSHTVASNLTLADPVVIELFNAGDTLALLGDINGAGGITKSTIGNLTLGGSNSFGGNVSFSNGVLTFSPTGLGNGNLTLDNATLVWAPGNSADISNRVITFGNNAVTFSMTNNVTLANDFGFTGSAPFNKDGAGTLTLAANTSFTGAVTVLNGNLTLGNGSATGSVNGAITLSNAASVLTVNRSGDPLISNLIHGVGNVVLAGAGAHSMNQPNDYTGTTTISNPGGSLVLVDANAIQGSTLLYNTTGGSVDFGTSPLVTFGALDGNKSLLLENDDVLPVGLTTGGNGGTTSYSGTMSGSGSFTKAGAGTMTISAPQTYTGATTVTGGILYLDPAATITTSSVVNVYATGRLTLDGATVSAPTLSNVAAGPLGGAVLELLNGATASFPGGLNALGNSANGYLISAVSGSLTAGSMSLGRSGIYTTEPIEASLTHGLVITGGDVDITGTLDMGIVSAANSSTSVRMDAGSLDVGGAITIGLNHGDRWSVIDVNGGVFNSTDAVTGVRLGSQFMGRAAFLSRGGVSTVERFQFGQGALGGYATVHVSGGELYVGSGGMVVGTSEVSYVPTLRLSGGILAAKASWSTAIPVETSGLFTLRAADAANVARNITLSGAITGAGTLVKEGDGTVTLSGPISYTGDTFVDEGTLVVTSDSLSDIAVVDVVSGATLNLPHGLQDTVADFLIDGVSQGPGIYTAANTGGRITGTGSLVVSAGAYSSWIDGFTSLTNPADKEKTADPDHDGMNNLQEFAFDGDPTSGAASGKLRTRIETVGGEQALVLTLPVRLGLLDPFLGSPSLSAIRDGVLYTIQGSNDLATFDQAVTEIIPALESGMPPLSGSDWIYQSFRLDGAIGGATPRGPRGFLRAATGDANP